MKVKLDENLDARLATLFTEAGHDPRTVIQENRSGCSDDEIFKVAVDEGRVLVTLDLDFANPFRFSPADTPGVLIIRVRRPLLSTIRLTIESALSKLGASAIRGKLWILEPGRIREYDPEEPT